MQYPDKPRFSWIDEICLNQEAPEERAKQVENMHEVCSHASQVLVWLGDAVTGTDKAFEWIAEQPSRAPIKIKGLLRVLKANPCLLERMQRPCSLACPSVTDSRPRESRKTNE